MRTLTFYCLLLYSATAFSLERSPLSPEPNSPFLRIIDTVSGTATRTIVTGDTNRSKRVLIYDFGHWTDDPIIIEELKHYLRKKRTVDVLIVGHSDSDHLGAVDSVLKYWKVRKSVRTGWERGESVGAYWNFLDDLENSVSEKGTRDFVIGDESPALGETWTLGDATITFLSGFSDLPDGWDVGVPAQHSRFESKARDAISIVVRLDYEGHSILFPGDAVGRTDESPWGQLIGTEKFLMDNRETLPIAADIVLAPHHGADNASSLPFIRAVDPEWVIFSAGVLHKHPKFNTFRRYDKDRCSG